MHSSWSNNSLLRSLLGGFNMNPERTAINYMPATYLAILHYAARVRQDWHDCPKPRNSGINCVHIRYLRSVAFFIYAHLLSNLPFDVPRHSCPTRLSPPSSAQQSCFQPMWMFRILIRCLHYMWKSRILIRCPHCMWMRVHPPMFWVSLDASLDS